MASLQPSSFINQTTGFLGRRYRLRRQIEPLARGELLVEKKLRASPLAVSEKFAGQLAVSFCSAQRNSFRFGRARAIR